MSPVGSIGRADRTLTVGEIELPLWSIDAYMENDQLHLSALIAVEKHTGNTPLPRTGETYDCGTSDGTEFRGELVSLSLEGRDLALNVRLTGGSGNWEDWT